LQNSEWIEGPPTSPGYYWILCEDTFATTHNVAGFHSFKMILHVIRGGGAGELWYTTEPLRNARRYYKLSEHPDYTKHIKIEEPII
jgi:hypothetical protein